MAATMIEPKTAIKWTMSTQERSRRLVARRALRALKSDDALSAAMDGSPRARLNQMMRGRILIARQGAPVHSGWSWTSLSPGDARQPHQTANPQNGPRERAIADF